MTSLILYAIAFLLLIISFIKNRKKTLSALKIALSSFKNIMPQFLVVIVIVGMILSILHPETISKIIGENSGFLGIILSVLIGSITLMPTFVAFSLGNTLLQNGAGYSQVAALISTLTLVGFLTFSLEAKYIGKKAAFLRNVVAIIFSFIVAIFVGRILSLL